MERFGFSESEWNALKAEALAVLVEAARQRRMVTYTEMAAAITGASFEPHDKRLWDLVGDVGLDEERAGRGLLGVLVVHKHGDMEPGHGFFELAAQCGRNTRDQTTCFINEVKRVHYEWSVRRA